MKKIYLVDGNAYIHRAYHALPPLTTSRGEMVNAVYGFLKMLLKIIKSEKPEFLAVCFDYPAATFRHKEFAAYKAHRKVMDDELKSQMPLVREAVRTLRIPSVEEQGYEADDLIATLARQAERDGAEVVVVSSDKDALQLVNDRIKVWNEGKNVVFDREKVRERYGLYPERLIDMFALMGDASDNVPGIRGIGEKTAVKLVQKFGSLDALLEGAGSLEGSVKEKVSTGKADALNSRRLVTLCDNVPLQVRWEDCRPGVPPEKEVIDFLCRMEFTSLLKELTTEPAQDTCAPGASNRTFDCRTVTSREMLEEVRTKIEGRGTVSVDLETTGLDPFTAEVVGFALAVDPDTGYYIPVGHREGRQLPLKEVLGGLKPFLEDPAIKKTGQNLKYDLLVLKKYGVDMQGIFFDTMVASYCLNPSRNGHSLKSISLDYLGHRMTEIEELIGKGAKQITMDRVPIEQCAPYACADAVVVLWLMERFEKQLQEKNLGKLFYDVEIPLVNVLARMECFGLEVDVAYLEKLSGEFGESLRTLEKTIFSLAGQEFNPNSPKQLSVILFEKLQLPVIKRTKTGYCTDEEVLRTLAPRHELPARLIEYRELQKLKSTYIDALLERSDPATRRVHTSFNQAVTATGRLSSSEPNLQNIPVRTEYGRKIRRAFIAGQGYVLLSCDYSQIDLRVLAHISGDEALIAAFKNGEDIHAATAREVFGGKAVTPELRRIAKTINFGIVYGMSAFSLGQQLNIPTGEAQEYIDHYFARYTGVKRWMEQIVKEAHLSGFVSTLLGRVRYLPDIGSPNRQMRSFAERTAMNTPIQGTSADIIKVAMVNIDRLLASRGDPTRMLVQVHDELLFEVPESALEATTRELLGYMESAVQLQVPVVVEAKFGANWNDMRPFERGSR